MNRRPFSIILDDVPHQHTGRKKLVWERDVFSQQGFPVSEFSLSKDLAKDCALITVTDILGVSKGEDDGDE